ncbi:MAG: glycosyltransferase family 4 protein [Lentisphaeria bacterium]|nr:glycosyltransferase family 4 protein [Lentisphaeria bacterium]
MSPPILYLLAAYPVWSETFLRQDLAYLLRSDLTLHPVALFPGDVPSAPGWPDVTFLSSPAARPPSTSRRERPGGASLLPRSLQTRVSLWQHRELLRALRRQVLQRGIAHVHAEFADLPGLLAAAVSRRTGCTYSIGVHARDVYALKYAPQVLFGRARFVTCCNTAALRVLLGRVAGLADRTHLIYHGLDLRQWPYRGGPRAVHPPLRLLFVGRFVEKKGIDTLLHAAAGMRVVGHACRLTLVGDGPLLVRLRSLAAELGLADAVTWTGIVPREAIGGMLAEADCLVVPSRVSKDGDRDGIPNVVLEAMASGTPVVGTDAGGLGEALNSRTGWVVAAGDAPALTEALRQLSAQPEQVAERCRRARELVEERFDADRLATRRVALLRDAALAGGRKQGPPVSGTG